ncbi:NAD(P)-dependent oxidoreductase [Streptomyces sp.]|uniref:NAD(P)-dependent oxidoreductase n=1 Tax=Streptomyces sp. TaxID=1931 RepID=UPI002F4257EA
MRILVLGANGATGRLIVAQALDAGHEVTAFVRAAAKAPAPRPGLRVVIGEVTSGQSGQSGQSGHNTVTAAVTGQDAVISALGSERSLKGLLAPTVIREATALVVRAMEQAGVGRLVFLSAFGVGDTARRAPAPLRLMYGVFLGRVFADKSAGERVLRASRLEWTLVYPVMLTNGPRTRGYRHGENLQPTGLAKVSRADVADFMLRETAEREYVRKTVVVAG